MAKYEQYAEYKNTDVGWIPEMPQGWQVTKLKYLIKTLESGVSVNAADYPKSEGELGVLKTSCVYTREFRAEENKTIFEEELSRVKCPVRAGSIIISRMNTPDLVGAAVYVKENCSNLYLPDRLWQTVYNDEQTQSSKYLHYFMYLKGFRDQISNFAEGASSSMQSIAKEDFLSINVLLPTRDEQEEIANFLDHETAQIDTLIEKQQTLIKLLKEKRQAVISHAVTKGLDPDAPMKDSGVEWLGNVPEHWEVGRYKFCTSRIVVGIAEAATHAYAETGVPILRSTNIKEEGLDISGMLFIKQEFAESNSSKYLYENDIITVRTGYPGTSAVIPEALDKSQCFTNLIATPKESMLSIFLSEYLNSHTGKAYFDLLGWGSAQKNISVPILQNIPIAWPDKTEQARIVGYLQQQRERYTKLVSKGEKQVELLKERRTALISAAVTGKIDVRGWVAQTL